MHPEDQKRENLWRAEVAKALALLERHPQYPLVRFQIAARDKEIQASVTLGGIAGWPRLSDERLDFLLKFLDIRGEEYLQFATDIDHVKAIEIMLKDFARMTWHQLSDGVPIDVIPPTVLFQTPHPTQSMRDKILRTAQDWLIKAYGNLAGLAGPGDSQQGRSTDGKKSRTFREPKPELLRNRDGVSSRRTAALALGISEKTLDRKVKAELLAPIGSGSLIRFKNKDLLRLLNQKKTGHDGQE